MKGEPEIKTETCIRYEDEAYFWLLPEHFPKYRIILTTIEEIIGPNEVDDWTRASFELIAHRLFGKMGRTTLRERLLELVRAGVVDCDNRPRDYLPRYTHILDRVERGERNPR